MISTRKALFILTLSAGTLVFSCKKDFLERQPIGQLSETVLATPAGVEGLLVGAYAALDGQDVGSSAPWSSDPSNWIWGSVAGGDAHKGSDAGDQAPINPIANWSVESSNQMLNDKWVACYEGISRANAVLKVLPKVESGLSDADRANIEGQAKFLRAHYYFELKRFFNKIPWIDETTTDYKQKNDEDVWPKIEADFQYAVDNLPETQSAVAKVNKWAASAYLGKVYMYEHKFTEAQTILDQVVAQGKTSAGIAYNLNPSIEDNFRPEKEATNPEAVFVVEMVANAGTGNINNSNQGQMLNFPYGNSPFGCCGFFQPTIDLANSYRTDANGLPYLDDYNQHAVKQDQGINSKDAFTPDAGNLDPRIDWTIGRRGIPYKDWGIHPGKDWIRDQAFSGPYSPKKNIYWQVTEKQFHDASSWAPGSAINELLIRFADVLLMDAEAHAQNGDLAGAEQLVNRVRTRAADPQGWVYQYLDPSDPLKGFSTTPAANYKISVYPAGAFASKDYALKAIYFERKLELAMEGHRMFDLNRWGIAQQTMNAFYKYEGAFTTDIKNGNYTTGKNEFWPIPQTQIDLTAINGQPTLTQNPSY